mmetsp:Transcript_32890/g.63318  ORF Transcript_32890/g.63318 Transcript_32890/m.63318 type:complete len:218 (+) Transcript_32890:606-1259(+)
MHMHVSGIPCGSKAADAPVLVAATASSSSSTATSTTSSMATEKASLHDNTVAERGHFGEDASGTAVGPHSDAARHIGLTTLTASRKMPVSDSAVDRAVASLEAQSLVASFSQTSHSWQPSRTHPLPPPSAASPSIFALASLSLQSSPPRQARQMRALTTITASLHWAPSASLTSLLSRLPPRRLGAVTPRGVSGFTQRGESRFTRGRACCPSRQRAA